MHGQFQPPSEPPPDSKDNPFVFLVFAIVIFCIVVAVTVTAVNGG